MTIIDHRISMRSMVNNQVTVEIETGIVQGRFPRRALKSLLEWYELYRERLVEDWQLAQQHQPLNRIPPLEWSPMLQITTADYLDGHRVRVCFSNGEHGTVNLADAAQGPMFEPLRDPAIFQRFEGFTGFSTQSGGRTTPIWLPSTCTRK